MGLRFYRRVHILPGVRLNIGTRGISASFGARGAWYTIGPHGRRNRATGIRPQVPLSALEKRYRHSVRTGCYCSFSGAQVH